MDLVSIIIPYYNASETIEETLVSAFSQTYQNIEIIVVDDGSDDQNKSFLESLNSKYDFKLIRQENKGLSGARNTAINNSKGKYFLPLDADDLLEADAIENLTLKPFDNKVGYTYGNLRLFGDENIEIRLPDYSTSGILSKNILTCTALIKKESWELVDGYDEEFRSGYEDWDFYLRLLGAGCLGANIHKFTFNYRKNKNSDSLLKKAIEIEEELCEKIISNNLKTFNKYYSTTDIQIIKSKQRFYKMVEYSKNCRFWKRVFKIFGFEPQIFVINLDKDLHEIAKILSKSVIFKLWRIVKLLQLKVMKKDVEFKTLDYRI